MAKLTGDDRGLRNAVNGAQTYKEAATAHVLVESDRAWYTTS
jgi:hypothetical protein